MTDDQRAALAAMQDFITRGKEKCFLLQGYAGTGKTFLIRRLAQWLESMKWSFSLAAPTGRAGKVLADKTGYPAGTIHRAIYSMDKLLEIPGAKEEDRFKFYYAIKLVAEDDRPRVIVVDESSMVSDQEGDEKFFRFGSGRLLKDLMEFAGYNQTDSKCQIVFVGDPAQLPPVNMNISPALDAEYLGKEFGVISRGALLKQVVRQAEDSAILAAASQIRSDIDEGRENRLDIRPDGNELIEVDPEQVMDLWSRECPKDREPSISPPLVCVTWKNETALAYNASVRAKLYGGGDGLHPLQPRDYLMVVANNRKTGLWNGELVLVKSIEGESESHVVAIRTKEGPKQITLIFRKVTVAVPDVNGAVTSVSSMILENVLFGKEREVTEDELIALWVHFKNRHLGLRPGTEQFKLELSADPYFNALRVKFGYAVTCHKAQGGEWPNAVVVFERGRPTLDCLRWTYTAITRAKKTLFGIGFPHFGIVGWAPTPGNETREDDHQDLDGEDADKPAVEDMPIISDEDIRLFRQAGFTSEMDWLAPRHLAAMREWRDAGVLIERVEIVIANHFFRYYLAKGGHKARIQVYFNARKKLTPRPCESMGYPTSAELVSVCDQCLARAYQEVPITPALATPELAEFRELRELHMAPAVHRLDGEIVEVQHLPYRERYRCRSVRNTRAVLDFCYNSRREFRNRPEIQAETTDRAFALKIIQELER